MKKNKVISKDIKLVYNLKEYNKIEAECDKINSLPDQVVYLSKTLEKLKFEYLNFLSTEHNSLTEPNKKHIINWFGSQGSIRENSQFKLILKILQENNNKSFLIFRNFLNTIDNFERYSNDNKQFESEEYFIESFDRYFNFNISYELYLNILRISDLQKKYENNILRIFRLIDVKKDFIDYEKQKNQYDFEKFIYSNAEQSMMFYKQLKSDKIKLIYLKFASDHFVNSHDKKYLKPEIKKIQNILEFEDNNSDGVLMKSDSKKIDKRKKERIINKFKWNDTEESILLIVDLLVKSNLIVKEKDKKHYAVLRDTFLNKNGQPFDNKQLAVVSQKNNSKLKENVNINKLFDQLESFLEKTSKK